jgi:hypothetical protein
MGQQIGPVRYPVKQETSHSMLIENYSLWNLTLPSGAGVVPHIEVRSFCSLDDDKVASSSSVGNGVINQRYKPWWGRKERLAIPQVPTLVVVITNVGQKQTGFILLSSDRDVITRHRYKSTNIKGRFLKSRAWVKNKTGYIPSNKECWQPLMLCQLATLQQQWAYLPCINNDINGDNVTNMHFYRVTHNHYMRYK